MQRLLVLIATLVLTACGGGGGGSGSEPESGSPGAVAKALLVNVSCVTQEELSGHTLCMSTVQVDGASYTTDSFVSASFDLNNDGYPDAILSSNVAITVNTTSPVRFIAGTASPTVYTTMTPVISGGTASAWFTRDIVVGDFDGDGKKDFYLADASEYTATGTLPWEGTTQYFYVNNGNGAFTKTSTGVSALVHGAVYGNSAVDGFGLALNTPWGSTTNYFHSINNVTATANPLPGAGQFFYTATIDVNRDGKKDIIGFSGRDFSHRIYLNNGSGSFTAGSVIPNFVNDNVVVESVAVADLNGDGWDDFVTVQIDRTAAKTEYSYMRVYINNQAGSFTDATATWVGTGYQNNYYKFFQVRAVDINNDGKTDLVFVRCLDTSTYTRKVEVLLNTGSSFNSTNFTNLQGAMQNTLVLMAGTAGNYMLVTRDNVMKAVAIK